jgi:hypothetical protein
MRQAVPVGIDFSRSEKRKFEQAIGAQMFKPADI